MIVVHVNDSYFWVYTRLVSIPPKQGLKMLTIGTLVTGSTASVCVLFVSIDPYITPLITLALILGTLIALLTIPSICKDKYATIPTQSKENIDHGNIDNAGQ